MTALILTTAIWVWLFRKPDPVFAAPLGWVLARVPLVKHVWAGWRECAFCGGFWIALALRLLLGLRLLPPFTPLFVVDLAADALACALGTVTLVALIDLLVAVAATLVAATAVLDAASHGPERSAHETEHETRAHEEGA